MLVIECNHIGFDFRRAIAKHLDEQDGAHRGFDRLGDVLAPYPIYGRRAVRAQAKAQKKLRAFARSRKLTVMQRADVMVGHFHQQAAAKGEIGGQARAMTVAGVRNAALRAVMG